METSSIHQFFIIISPPKIVKQYVIYKKKCVKESIGHFESESSIAHITLFNYEDKHNDNRLYHLESQVSQFSSFGLCTKDFGVFEHGENRTIYIDIIHKNPAREVAEKLDGRKINPHITIARNLEPHAFDKAWKQFKNESFSHYFKCNYITVLKRTPGCYWDNYMNLYFSH